MTQRLEALGYWFNESAPSALPRPQRLIGRWPARQRSQVARYLRAGSVFESYRAGTFCRFACDIPARVLGRRDLTDGVWVWPEGLAHYVEAHSVRLPDRFARHVARAKLPEPIVIAEREGTIDETSWLAWGRDQGACLDLTSWEVPGRADQKTIERALAKLPGPWKQRIVILLARPQTRDVVLGLPRGQLAVVNLGDQPSTAILASWDDWPVRGRSRRRPR